MGLRIAFKQLATCIHDLGRQFGIGDEAYAHYAVERLEIAEICTVNITHLKNDPESNAENAEQESHAIISYWIQRS